MSDEKANQRKRELLQKYNDESNRVTRESVETALFLLMEEKDFSNISVTDIVNRAGVSRSAYYRNYNSKEEILSSVFDQCVDAIMESLRPSLMECREQDVYLRLFETAAEQQPFFSMISKANLEWMFLTEVNHRLIKRIPENLIAEQYHLCSWIGATVNILMTWLRHGMQESPEQMAEICSGESRLSPYFY